MPLVRVISREASRAFRDIPAAIEYKKPERRNCDAIWDGLSVGSRRNEFWRRLRPTNFTGRDAGNEEGAEGEGVAKSFTQEKEQSNDIRLKSLVGCGQLFGGDFRTGNSEAKNLHSETDIP